MPKLLLSTKTERFPFLAINTFLSLFLFTFLISSSIVIQSPLLLTLSLFQLGQTIYAGSFLANEYQGEQNKISLILYFLGGFTILLLSGYVFIVSYEGFQLSYSSIYAKEGLIVSFLGLIGNGVLSYLNKRPQLNLHHHTEGKILNVGVWVLSIVTFMVMMVVTITALHLVSICLSIVLTLLISLLATIKLIDTYWSIMEIS